MKCTALISEAARESYMRLLRLFAQGLFLLVLFSCAAVSRDAAGKAPDTYVFFDEATGLSIELPKAWERRDPNEVKRTMLETNERFWKRPVAEGLSKSGVLFMTMASPYTGPETERSFLTCVASPLPPSMDIKPGDVKLLLETTIDATYGKYEKDITISKAEKIEISGKEAYRLSISKKNNEPGSFLFVALLNRGLLLQCSGAYDSMTRSAVERSLQSLRIK
jgi:hypothetical protein